MEQYAHIYSLKIKKLIKFLKFNFKIKKLIKNKKQGSIWLFF